MAKKSDIVNQIGGLLFVGATIVGTGLGLLFDQAGTGSVIGVGAGFILMAAARISLK